MEGVAALGGCGEVTGGDKTFLGGCGEIVGGGEVEGVDLGGGELDAGAGGGVVVRDG